MNKSFHLQNSWALSKLEELSSCIDDVGVSISQIDVSSNTRGEVNIEELHLDVLQFFIHLSTILTTGNKIRR